MSLRTSLIVFDLDGVITDEKPYWDSAREALRCLLGADAPADPLPQPYIYWVKNRAINSNWDVAYVTLCAIRSRREPFSAFFDGCGAASGAALIRYAGETLAATRPVDERTEIPYPGALWRRCHAFCQEVHDERIRSGEARHLGVMPGPEAVRILDGIRRDFPVTLGVATGRIRSEAMDALDALGLTAEFDAARIVTHDMVHDAEATIQARGDSIHLGKPHPYVLLKAIYPGESVDELLARASAAEAHSDVVFVGDTPSDILAAKAAGACSVGVLGAIRDEIAKAERRAQLQGAGCDFLVDTIGDIPDILRGRG